MLFPAHDYLPARAADLDHVEWRSGGYAESLALSDGEIVNAAVRSDRLTVRSHEFARSIWQRLTLLGKVGIDKALVVAAGDEADFLRVGLLRERETMMAGECANFGLNHFA